MIETYKKNIHLLDCTLRDGGYLNNWKFGNHNIKSSIRNLIESNVEIAEIGFMRGNEDNDPDRAVWNTFDEVDKYIPITHGLTKFAVMCEVFNPFPLEKIPVKKSNSVDIIRVIVWRQYQDEALEYCRQIIKKGYKVSIQPDRVNQYTIDEFRKLVAKFLKIRPWAIYIVDSNGFLDQEKLLEYLLAANSIMDEKVLLGYHGHNNMLQAVGTAEKFCDLAEKRGIIIDGSVTGIGRSSGNLNIEIIANYLNKKFNKNYSIKAFARIYDEVLETMGAHSAWGYSLGTFLTSVANVNPNYAEWMKKEYKLTYSEIFEIVKTFSERDKVIFNKTALLDYIVDYNQK